MTGRIRLLWAALITATALGAALASPAVFAGATGAERADDDVQIAIGIPGLTQFAPHAIPADL
jgi:hypothetical protein